MQWIDHRSTFQSCRMHHPTSFFRTKDIDGTKIAIFRPCNFPVDFGSPLNLMGFLVEGSHRIHILVDINCQVMVIFYQFVA